MNYKLPITIVLLCYHAVLGSDEVAENEGSETAADGSLHRVRRGGLSMLRLGRGLQMLRLGKRALPMLRLGRSASAGLSDEELQYLFSLMRNERQVPLPRYGKDMSLEYMIMNALKNAELNSDMYSDDDDTSYAYGYDLGSAPERHIRPAPRPGMRYRRSTDGLEQGSQEASAQKQMSAQEQGDSYADDDEVVKRAMRMLRLGRGMRMLRLGKRPMDSEEITEEEKRALRLLRLGKRPFKMLRMGRSDSDSDEIEKRALRLLRLGRSATNES